MVTEMTRPVGAHDMTLQAGKLAKLADGAVVVTYGQTQVIATCVTLQPPRGDRLLPAHDRRRGAGLRGREDPRLLLPA